jgi:hypothetical protein
VACALALMAGFAYKLEQSTPSKGEVELRMT